MRSSCAFAAPAPTSPLRLSMVVRRSRFAEASDEWANVWPKPAAWDFVALGKGHDSTYWTEFLRALHA